MCHANAKYHLKRAFFITYTFILILTHGRIDRKLKASTNVLSFWLSRDTIQF